MDGLILSDDVFVQPFFHLEQFLRLGLQHLADRNASPLGDDFGDVVVVHHLVQLVFGFPLIALFFEFTLEAQAFGFLLSRPLVITLQAGLLLFGQQPVQLALHSF